MTIKSQIKTLAIASVVLFSFTSCSDDDDAPGQADNDIVVTARADAELSIFVQALEITDLDDVLENDNGTFTVLAPTNAAFGDIDITQLPNLREVLLNHVIATRLTSGDLTASGSGYATTEAEAGPGDAKVSIFFDTSNGVRFNNQAAVVSANIPATNGIIHKVDEIIDLPDLSTFATADSELSSLASALTEANLVSTLQGDTEFTVLAPVNAGISAFLEANSWANVGEIPDEDLSQTLLNHVIPGAVLASDLTAEGSGYVSTSSTAGPNQSVINMFYNTEGGVSFNGIASAVANRTDIIATNGVIHQIDAVVTLPDVTTFVSADPNFSSLLASLTAYNDFTYVNTLQADGPFTVFAPNNAAFTALLATDDMWNVPSDIPTTVLSGALNLHVVSGSNVRAAQIANLPGGTATTLGGNVTIDASTLVITGPANTSTILSSSTDIQATNGVIHAIDTVLLPSM